MVKAEGNHLYSIVLPRSDTLGGNRDLNPSSNPNPNSGPDLDADLMDGKQGDGEMCLVELMPALRSRVFLRRNGYVLVDLDRGLLGGRENKIVGVVVGVVLGGRMEREWRGMGYWPAEFVRVRAWDDVDDSGEGPRMPESGDDDDDDDEKGEDG